MTPNPIVQHATGPFGWKWRAEPEHPLETKQHQHAADKALDALIARYPTDPLPYVLRDVIQTPNVIRIVRQYCKTA